MRHAGHSPSRDRIIGALLLVLFTPLLYAQDGKDLDAYKFRISANWYFVHPTGSIQGKDNSGTFDLNKDFHFTDYSTFSGSLDWRFARKHHLTFTTSPISFSRTATLNRTVQFSGRTFDVNTQATAEINYLSFAPGYQYDLIRRNHGYVAIAAQVNFLSTEASITATSTVNGQTTTRRASQSLLAPIPILGPHIRWYPLSNSNRLSFDGSIHGMYFFGYGNFVSADGSMGIGLTHHLNLKLGYQMGSRFDIHGVSDQLGVRLTEKGPLAGLEFSW